MSAKKSPTKTAARKTAKPEAVATPDRLPHLSPTFPAGAVPPIYVPWPHFLFGEVMSTDETRRVLCGVTITNGNFYATNGRTAVRVPSDHVPVDLSVIIPAVIVQAIEAEVSEVILWTENFTAEAWNEPREWGHNPGVMLYADRVEFKQLDGAIISARYIEGRFPDFDKVITKRPEAQKYSFSAELLYKLAKCLHGTDISRMGRGKVVLSISGADAPAFVDLRRDENLENAKKPGVVAMLMPCKPE